MYKYVYARSNSSHKCEYKTLEEAIDRTCKDLELGRVTPIKIEKDGEVLLSYETLMTILRNRREEKRLREENKNERT